MNEMGTEAQPVRTYGNMPLPLPTESRPREELRKKILQNKGYSRKSRSNQRQLNLTTRRRIGLMTNDQVLDALGRKEIPVQMLKQRRDRKPPKRLINEMEKNIKEGKHVFAGHKRRNTTKKAAIKAAKNRIAARKGVSKKKPTRVSIKPNGNGNTNMMAPPPARANYSFEENDPNPYAVRLGAIKRKYEAMEESLKQQIKLAISDKRFKNIAPLKSQLAALPMQKKAEQNAARKGIVEERQQADELAGMFGQVVGVSGPVAAPPAPYAGSTSAPAGFVMRPATGGPGWGYPTGGPGGPPPGWGGENL